MVVKRVSILNGYERPLGPLATFYMEGEHVVSVFHSPFYEREILDEGIGYVGPKRFTKYKPRDGRPFFDALEDVYAMSTQMRVIVTDEPTPPVP
jgi:hypothetical protein